MDQLPDVDPVVDEILHAALQGLTQILGDTLSGLYLTGSLVMGGFDLAISDIDLVAITHTPLNDGEFQALDQLHGRLTERFPAWVGRIEILYVTQPGLATFRTHPHPIAVISPGEPFERRSADMKWAMNWYLVRTAGKTLYGPPPHQLIPPISKREFLACVAHHAQAWRSWIDEATTRKDCAYAVLTLCRAAHSHQHGEQVSKQQAAAWATQTFPAWADLIRVALDCRIASAEGACDPQLEPPTVRRFIQFVLAQMELAK